MKSVMIAVHLLGEQHFTPKSLIYINKAASFAMKSRIQELVKLWPLGTFTDINTFSGDKNEGIGSRQQHRSNGQFG